jgi:hypothetical protein
MSVIARYLLKNIQIRQNIRRSVFVPVATFTSRDNPRWNSNLKKKLIISCSICTGVIGYKLLEEYLHLPSVSAATTTTTSRRHQVSFVDEISI